MLCGRPASPERMPNFARGGRRPVPRSLLRPLMGLVTIVVIVGAFALAANLFRGASPKAFRSQ
jgi:hypothetical protein